MQQQERKLSRAEKRSLKIQEQNRKEHAKLTPRQTHEIWCRNGNRPQDREYLLAIGRSPKEYQVHMENRFPKLYDYHNQKYQELNTEEYSMWVDMKMYLYVF